MQLASKFHNAGLNFDATASARSTMRSNGVCSVQYVTDSVGGYVTAFHGVKAEFSTIHNPVARIVLAFAPEHGFVFAKMWLGR